MLSCELVIFSMTRVIYYDNASAHMWRSNNIVRACVCKCVFVCVGGEGVARWLGAFPHIQDTDDNTLLSI